MIRNYLLINLSPVCPKRPQRGLTLKLKAIKLRDISQIVLILLFILSLLLIDDIIPANPRSMVNFSHIFGREYTDDNAQALIQTDDGGYAIAGFTWSYGIGGDMWLIKMNSQGIPEWNRTFGGDQKEMARILIQTSDTGYVLAGSTWSYGAGMNDLWVVKLDNLGNIQWQKSFGGLGEDTAFGLVEDKIGGYIVAGYTSSYGAGDRDMWLIRIDSYGNLDWTQTFGGKNEDVATSLIKVNDGGYILAGYTSSYGAGDKDLWLVKTSPSGDLEWNKTFGGEGRDQARAIVQTSTGYAIAGETRLFNDQYRDFWLVKTDFEGNKQWSETYGGTEREWVETIIHTKDHGFLLAGFTTTLDNTGYANVLLVKTSMKGEMEWIEQFGGQYHDVVSAIVETDEGFLFTGITDAPKFLPYYSGGNIWLFKTDKNGKLTNESDSSLNLPELVLELFPFSFLALYCLKLRNKNREKIIW